MPSVTSWAPPNTASQPRAGRYPNDVWNLYEADLVHQYRQGGLSVAHQWISSQKVPNFGPSKRQLEYRLKEVWLVDRESSSVDSPAAPRLFSRANSSSDQATPSESSPSCPSIPYLETASKSNATDFASNLNPSDDGGIVNKRKLSPGDCSDIQEAVRKRHKGTHSHIIDALMEYESMEHEKSHRNEFIKTNSLDTVANQPSSTQGLAPILENELKDAQASLVSHFEVINPSLFPTFAYKRTKRQSTQIMPQIAQGISIRDRHISKVVLSVASPQFASAEITTFPDSFRFACPYYKCDPVRYSGWRRCHRPNGWATVHHLRRHLYKCHILRCKRCNVNFPSASLFEDHLSAKRLCGLAHRELIDADCINLTEGLNETQRQSLKDGEVWDSGLEFEKWYRVYRIVFPNKKPETVPTPYYEGESIFASDLSSTEVFDGDSFDKDSEDEEWSELKSVSALAPSLASSSMARMKILAFRISRDHKSTLSARGEESGTQDDKQIDDMDGLWDRMSSISLSNSTRAAQGLEDPSRQEATSPYRFLVEHAVPSTAENIQSDGFSLQSSKNNRKLMFPDRFVDSATTIVETIWPLSASTHSSVLPLRAFILETVRRSRTSFSTLQVALYYLILIKAHVPRHEFPFVQVYTPRALPLRCGRRMFLAALILASNSIHGRKYKARVWSKISGLKVQEINNNEKIFLQAIDFDLNVPEHLFERWRDILIKYGAHTSPSPGSSTPPAEHALRSVVPFLTPELDMVDISSSSIDAPFPFGSSNDI